MSVYLCVHMSVCAIIRNLLQQLWTHSHNRLHGQYVASPLCSLFVQSSTQIIIDLYCLDFMLSSLLLPFISFFFLLRIDNKQSCGAGVWNLRVQGPGKAVCGDDKPRTRCYDREEGQ